MLVVVMYKTVYQKYLYFLDYNLNKFVSSKRDSHLVIMGNMALQKPVQSAAKLCNDTKL